MITVLPEKWAIKASNDEEAKIIQPYANEKSIENHCSPWSIRDCTQYHLSIENNLYYGGSCSGYNGFTKITIEEFQTLVLNQSSNNYEIY
jgi:hypothetical protein